ncbi:hypothetical protein SERLADRAFT_442622 [Serpula lacrymans var. lacrymans S7.9]|uniref:Uncharacterized protein n=1 Tax=Serpula lacrymans var. lacrymans (strain S7.9) TaxID=578457 RepID=F8PAF3_SERL9|nr:uncharacterized protein SERLADRAFT_442622 [Serpula lacrymans var. lacrymans S7.9]EGO19792.1 hypothetical protein SERLADRAFT_442622 [Serpula lacrymans var. lacrymans S7.9]
MTKTIAAGRQALKLFSQAMDVDYHHYVLFIRLAQEYLKAADGLRDKSWNFLKMHMNKHAFEDIKAKGITQNYNTKPNEQLHGLLKDSYQFRTNFKHVAEQDIAAFDSELMGDLKGDEVDSKITGMSHVSLGSKCPATSFQGLEESRKDDAAFMILEGVAQPEVNDVGFEDDKLEEDELDEDELDKDKGGKKKFLAPDKEELK